MSVAGLVRSKVAKNGAWLLLLQAVNTILPLVTIPYVTRVLGVSEYGVFSLALNWISYFQVVVGYGFVLTGARKVALIGSDDQGSLQSLYNNIIWARIVLLAVMFIVMNVVYVVSGMSLTHYFCMLMLYLMVVGVAFQQTWLFQGKEDMRFITLANAAARLLSVVLIFALIRGSDQVLLYCFLYSITYIGSSAIGMAIAYRKYGLKLGRADAAGVVSELKDGWYLFTSSAMSKIFSGVGVTILGFSASIDAVGAYSAIYKIPYCMNLVFSPIGQALYPHVSKLFAESESEALAYVRKTAVPIVGFVAVLCLLLIVARYPLVDIAFGSEYLPYADLAIPLSLWMLIGVLNNFLGVQTLVGSGHQKEYSRAFAVGVAAIVVFNIGLGLAFGAMGIAFATMASEAVLSVALVVQIVRTLDVRSVR